MIPAMPVAFVVWLVLMIIGGWAINRWVK